MVVITVDVSRELIVWLEQTISGGYHHYLLPQLILAQAIEDPDILGQMQTAWNNFVESGQVWALLIGVGFGYMFKGFTSY